MKVTYWYRSYLNEATIENDAFDYDGTPRGKLVVMAGIYPPIEGSWARVSRKQAERAMGRSFVVKLRDAALLRLERSRKALEKIIASGRTHYEEDRSDS